MFVSSAQGLRALRAQRLGTSSAGATSLGSSESDPLHRALVEELPREVVWRTSPPSVTAFEPGAEAARVMVAAAVSRVSLGSRDALVRRQERVPERGDRVQSVGRGCQGSSVGPGDLASKKKPSRRAWVQAKATRVVVQGRLGRNARRGLESRARILKRLQPRDLQVLASKSPWLRVSRVRPAYQPESCL